jgi:opacity protein-like surface antigen
MDVRTSRPARRVLTRWLSLVFALMPIALASVAQAEDSRMDAEKSWFIAPYLWGPNVKGDVGIAQLSVPLDVSVEELGSGIELGAMGYIRWTRDRMFLYAEGLGLDFEDESFAAFFDQHVHSQVVFAELGIGRHWRWDVTFPTRGELQLSPYVGARYVWLNVKARSVVQTLKAEDTWQDLALGVMLQGPLYGKFSYVMKADAAGFNLDHDRYWNFIGGVAYEFNPTWMAVVAYRVSRFDADQGGGNDLDLSLRAAGPLVGVALQF